MPTYISLLRGINVSGQKKILMADLRELYKSIGFKNVETYIQSGNVVFENDGKFSNRAIAEKIVIAIEKKYNFHVPVIIKQAADLVSALNDIPFLRELKEDPARLAISFLEDRPKPQNLKKLEGVDFSPDCFIIKGSNIYIYCPQGFGHSKLTNTFFERKLELKTTSRNLRTVSKLIEMSS